MDTTTITQELKEWATPRQAQVIDAILEAGSMNAAARNLNVHHSTVQKVVRSVKNKAAKSGWSPDHGMTIPIAPGYVGRGTSTLYRVDPITGEKEMTLQWVKTRADDEAREAAMKEAYEALAEELPRLAPRKPYPIQYDTDLLNLFTFSDYHIGALGWANETGADWNLEIAEDLIYRVFERMIDSAPSAGTAIINQLGDFLHTDGFKALTPKHGNLLDASGRYPEIVSTAVRILRRIIDRCLDTHEHVHVILAEGNHDEGGSVWLRTMFAALYENEPRVTVDQSSFPYYAYVHGNTFLGFHHGHLSKNGSLPAIFSQAFRKEWGNTEFTYIHTGHRHHREEKEHANALVVQHPTLAAPDAHAARGGWMSKRMTRRITYHKLYGEAGSEIVTPEMVN